MPAARRMEDGLTVKEGEFVRQYLIDLNAYRAALRAGYSPRTAKRTGSELIHRPRVQAAITAAMAARSRRTEVSQDEVLQRLWLMATADSRELIEYRRSCCRYCWGEAFRYQRTAGEMDRDRDAWELLPAKLRAGRTFSVQGGIGYHAKRDPNPECPECFGDGIGQVAIRDTRTLSQAAAQLFAGVKQTREGLEVKTHSQHEALRDVGRHLGLFKDKIEHTGKDGGPVQTESTVQFYLPTNGRDG